MISVSLTVGSHGATTGRASERGMHCRLSFFPLFFGKMRTNKKGTNDGWSECCPVPFKQNQKKTLAVSIVRDVC